MVLVFQRDETERLQVTVTSGGHRRKHFRHAMYRAGLSLKSDFDKITLPYRLAQPKKTTGYGNSLELAFSALAIVEHHQCQDRTAQMNSASTPLRIRLGEVGHSQTDYDTRVHYASRLRKHMYGFL